MPKLPQQRDVRLCFSAARGGNGRVVAAALAGNGFKFALVVSEILAEFLEEESPVFDVKGFLPGRFKAQGM